MTLVGRKSLVANQISQVFFYLDLFHRLQGNGILVFQRYLALAIPIVLNRWLKITFTES